MGSNSDASSASADVTPVAPVAPLNGFSNAPIDRTHEVGPRSVANVGTSSTPLDAFHHGEQVNAISKDLAYAQEKLGEHYFEKGAKVYRLPEGSRDRAVWQGKVDQLNRELGLVTSQAGDSIPRVVAARDASEDRLRADAARARDVAELAYEPNPATGKAYGMVEAAKIVDARLARGK
jgi:hypothetical protein